MTDTPSALELYDDPQTTWVGSDSEGNTVRLKLEVLADAALDELTRKLKQAETTINQWEVKAADLMRERNEAEAKVAKLENQNAYYAVQFEFDPRNDTRLVDAVKRVEQAEAFLHELGLQQVRVRDHEQVARIEESHTGRFLRELLPGA